MSEKITFRPFELDFMKALRNGEVDAVRRQLETEPSLKTTFRSDLRVIADAFNHREAALPMFKVLIAHGFEINVWKKGGLSLLAQSISKKMYDVTEFLLQSGANPNLNREIITALNVKDGESRLKFVRLLLKFNVDVNKRFQLYDTGSYFTALDWTKDEAVRKVLLARGAKTNAELMQQGGAEANFASSPKQPNVSHTKLIEYFETNYGPVEEGSISETLSRGFPIEIRVIRPAGNRNHFTLFTVGLSSRPMNVPAGQEMWRFAELFMQLPGDWKVDKLDDPVWNWPIKWLLKIAQYPHANSTWLGGAFTIIANEEPPQPLAKNTQMTCLMLLANKTFKREDESEVYLYQVTPIHTDERDLERTEGVPALMRAFDRSSVPFIYQPNRPSVAAKH